MTRSWFAYVRPNPDARLRLFCLPFAGGAAVSYRSWAQHLPDSVEVLPVELPGRGTRIAEPPALALDPLVEQLAQAITPLLDRPFALWGHSMGALLCYELARQLRRTAGLSPAQLLVSAHRAPHLPNPHGSNHKLADPALLEKIRSLNGTPPDVLAQPDLVQLLLPVVRADFTVCETYVHTPAPPLECPIAVFGGTYDPMVERWQLAAWSRHTQHPVQVQMLPGDHFYFQSNPPAFFALLREALLREQAAPAAEVSYA
ncbi:MAG TPA: alpha/beta fold hydrolase [Roseiflexaceae bacterium]|nr:alpha/beta fold hydrolase [Roseiflexaceae bacterium]